MTSRKVIVFGPTGAVGSTAARTAGDLGANVALAMRDCEKNIPGLDAATEKQGSYDRVTADLTKPETVISAVNATNAKHAFVYCAHTSPDHMKSTFEALKTSGIELVVFLSSFTVRGDLQAIGPTELIPYVHAQAEISLHSVFADNQIVAVRPGAFASNTTQYRAGLNSGEVKIFKPDQIVDCIASEDIGRVCGTILAQGLQSEDRIIYLYGPQLLSQADSVRILAKILGKDPKIIGANEEEAYQIFMERGVPPVLAKNMINQAEKADTGGLRVFGLPIKEEDLSNVQQYSGGKATTFEEWAEKNKTLFLS